VSGRFPGTHPRDPAARRRDYFLYVPEAVVASDRVPLLVMLHGCGQDAHAFAEGTRMNALADEHRFIVLYPEQPRSANLLRCWNWFHPDAGNGGGETALLAALVRVIRRRYPIDPSRVYVAGISAGGAMTANLALHFGTLFAACGIVAGAMCQGADSAASALRTLRHGARRAPEEVAQEIANSGSRARAVVPALVMYGDRDRLVSPRNGEQLGVQLRRFAELVLGSSLGPGDCAEREIPTEGRSYRQRDYTLQGLIVLREIIVQGLGHAWSGGDARHRFHDASPPDASRLLWEFLSPCRRPQSKPLSLTSLWSLLGGRRAVALRRPDSAAVGPAAP
jgi:poly(hydroxyalkanoate) depolymerase family esterase